MAQPTQLDLQQEQAIHLLVGHSNTLLQQMDTQMVMEEDCIVSQFLSMTMVQLVCIITMEMEQSLIQECQIHQILWALVIR